MLSRESLSSGHMNNNPEEVGTLGHLLVTVHQSHDWPSLRDHDSGSGCNVRTQDPENFDEEVKSLVTAWRWIHGDH